MKTTYSDITIRILELGLELGALGRAALSTWLVVLYVTNGNVPYSVFTTIVIEGVFFVSLVLIRRSSTAVLSAVGALVFTAVTQILELRVLEGTITADEREIMRYVIALAPVTILGLGLIRRLFDNVDVAEVVGKVTQAITPAHYPTQEELPEAAVAHPLPSGSRSKLSQPATTKNGVNEP